MPFILYQRSTSGSRSRFERLRDIQLAGDGPLKKAAYASANANGTPGWHVTEEEIIRHIGGMEPEAHAIIIDLKPHAKDIVSLYHLRDVWGYSDECFTPLALRLQCLYVDQRVDDVPAFKRGFDAPAIPGEFVGEFLYVHGGMQGGPWTWGKVGQVNGALLWPDAFAYLSGNLGKALSVTSGHGDHAAYAG